MKGITEMDLKEALNLKRGDKIVPEETERVEKALQEKVESDKFLIVDRVDLGVVYIDPPIKIDDSVSIIGFDPEIIELYEDPNRPWSYERDY
jgi:hypothetical protein